MIIEVYSLISTHYHRYKTIGLLIGDETLILSFDGKLIISLIFIKYIKVEDMKLANLTNSKPKSEPNMMEIQLEKGII